MRSRLADVMEVLRSRPQGDRVRWVRQENLHVTLHFLGDIERQAVPGIAEAVRKEVANIESFEMQARDPHPFPSSRRPRVVAVDLESSGQLEKLTAAVQRGIVAAGFEQEDRAFHAHLTLARIRGRDLPSLTGEFDLGPPVRVTEVLLLQSDLRPEGPIYSELETMTLA